MDGLSGVGACGADGVYFFGKPEHPHQKIDWMIGNLHQCPSTGSRFVPMPPEPSSPVEQIMRLGKKDLIESLSPSPRGFVSTGESALSSNDKLEICLEHRPDQTRSLRKAPGDWKAFPHVNSSPHARGNYLGRCLGRNAQKRHLRIR